MKLREKAILPNQLYSENKTKIKKVYKEHGLKFNQGALHSANIFLWQGDGQQVEGRFTKNDDGVTVHSELVVTADERTPFFDDLKELVEELGGSWEISGEEELQKEEVDERDKEIKKYEFNMYNQLFNEERKARQQGFQHCPVIKPMITKMLEERYVRFSLDDLTPYDVLAEVYATVDSEYKKCPYCKKVLPRAKFTDANYNGECEDCYMDIVSGGADAACGR